MRKTPRVRMSIVMRTAFGLALALVLAGGLAAQIDEGAIVGHVTDASGAAIANATVVVTNRATNVSTTRQTNSDGSYQVLALIPGTYTVRASAPGFAARVSDNVEIHVQSRPSVDFTLPVGSVQQQAEVVAAQPLLQTQTADVGGVVNSQQINDLPLNGRRYSDLALLSAGVQHNIAQGNNQTPDRFSSNGNLETQNYFSLDGVDNNSGSTNLQEGSVQAVQPPPDALQEFRLQTRTYSAEFGTSAGAVVNASIKSGTNQFHGDVFEFLRNNKLDSNTFFNNAHGTGIGHFSQNQFGGTFGGPIIHDRTFFFADYQGFISRKAQTINSVVPTPLMKQGNFTELKNILTASAAGQTGCVVGNVLAPQCIDPVGAKLLALYPDPNIAAEVAHQGVAGAWTGNPNYQFQYAVPNNTHSTDVRIDHTLNSANQVFGRYSYQRVNRQDPPWTSNFVAGNGNFATQYRIHSQSLALSWNDALSTTMLNQLRFGFNRVFAHSDPIGVQLGKSLAANYGLNGIPAGPNSAGLPPIDIAGVVRLGTAPWRPQFQVSQVWQAIDTLSLLRGNHSYEFGYEFHDATDNFLDIRNLQGNVGASGIYTSNNGFGVADFLLGDASTAAFTTPLVAHNYHPGHAFFAQDSWRVAPHLTVNYGLRYELFAPTLSHDNSIANFSPANGGAIVAVPTTASGWYQRSSIHPDRNDFAPRFGFSYQMSDHLVWRGGYGVFYQHLDRIGSESMLDLNPPFVIDGSLNQGPGSTTPVFQLKNGFPAAQFTPALVNLTKLQIRAQDPNQRTSYVEQASFGPELQLSNTMVLDVVAVGNWGRKMQRLRNGNQGLVTGTDAAGNPIVSFPYANLNTVQQSANGSGQHAFLELATHDGNTNYNALEVIFSRRLSHGLGLDANYTWSHNLADFVDQLSGGSTPANAYQYGLEKSNSIFDVRHRVVGNVTWMLPIGQGGALLKNGAAGRWLGGWQANAILTLQTGVPFSIGAPDKSFTGPAHSSRPNCIGDPFAGASTNPSAYLPGGGGFYINPKSFALPAGGQFGTCAPRNVHGPGFENLDLSLFKSFRLSESKSLQLRGEFFNALNHANFGNPSAFYSPSSLGSFGVVSSTVGDPREVQLALKFYF